MGGDLVPDAAVLTENELIVAVGPAAGIKCPADDTLELDAQGGFILPGPIDAHVHLTHPGEFDLAARLNQPFSLNYYLTAERMRRALELGVTTVRDTAGADLQMKVAQEKGLIVGPRLQISIVSLSQAGGHPMDGA